ncbi:hypothetical protein C6P40_005178 [Pichia californica]|uniref:Uncharacterized protein n=1 Tax=Pichia californica TaxID=460514 RepID=A0A9P7BFW8_9ASCO|nr:hypothetical protein C6P42_005446 [[Candida] californica]KAG0689356.1 hypothetical protein C6P40_005178 [[Candida] californica]
MLKGSTKKFFIFVCIVLAMFATLSMTPETQRKQFLKPITSLYSGDSGKQLTSTEAESMNEFSDSPKVMVKDDDAEKTVLNVEVDPEHPDQLLPVVDAENKVVDDDEDSSISDSKLEAILNEAPL